MVIDAPAQTVRERVGRWGDVEEAGNGRCLLRMNVESLDWPALVAGAVGVEFTVVAPPELRELVGEWADRFRRAAAR